MPIIDYAEDCLLTYFIADVFICRIVKNAMKSVPTFSFEHLIVISRTALFLMEAAHKAGTEFASNPVQTAHSTPSAEGDVKAMYDAIVSSKAAIEVKGRNSHSAMTDPLEKGFAKLHQGWLQNYLQRSCDSEIEDKDPYDEPEVHLEDVAW